MRNRFRLAVLLAAMSSLAAMSPWRAADASQGTTSSDPDGAKGAAMPDHMPAHERRSDSAMPMAHEMQGMLGPYPMTRESSGTSWQPEAVPMRGVS